jgi:hypothetical protein
MDLDVAIALTVAALRSGKAAHYGYDLFVRDVVAEAARKQAGQDQQLFHQLMNQWSPLFFDAGWELCRRGVVRPGVKKSGDQAVDDGGYSITQTGQALLGALDDSDLLLLQPGSLAATFSGFQARFGSGFNQRAQEAVRCRNAEAWLACCSMAGAAAEAVLLAAAIAKTGDEQDVLDRYGSAGGRSKVVNVLVGQASQPVQNTLKAFTGIIAIFRDEAAHGKASELSNANADEALRQLLHMCQWVNKEWQALTA